VLATIYRVTMAVSITFLRSSSGEGCSQYLCDTRSCDPQTRACRHEVRWRSPIVPGQYFHYIWSIASLQYPCHNLQILVSCLAGTCLITIRRTVGLVMMAVFHRRLMTIYHIATSMPHATIPSFPYGFKLCPGGTKMSTIIDERGTRYSFPAS